MDILQKRFSTGDVLAAADVSNANLQSWIKRNIIIGQRLEGGGGPGKYRSFSFFNLTEIAIAAALINIGISSPQDAFRAAQRFSHTGDGGISWGGDDGLQDDAHRWPGLPYHHALGDTYLLIDGDKSDLVLSEDGKVRVGRIAGRPSIGCVALNLTELFARLVHRLGYDYRLVLDDVYQEKA